MTKDVRVLTGLGRGGRIGSMLAMLMLVMSLIGGVGAFVPVTELSELDDTLSVDFVLAEELAIEDEDVASVGDRSIAVELCNTAWCIEVPRKGAVLASGQVISMLRNSGIQRAVRPTGPPTVLA
jgi:hypothetical protein